MACFGELWAAILSLFSPENVEFSAWSDDLVDAEDALLRTTDSEYAVRVVCCIVLSKIWLIALTDNLDNAFYCTVRKQSGAKAFEAWQILGGDNFH